MTATVYQGDCRTLMDFCIADKSVHTCVTSPPYFGLRDYGVAGQLGLEATPDAFVAAMVDVFRSVRNVLRDDGTVWLNLGDSYSQGGNGGGAKGSKQTTNVGALLPPKHTAGFGPKQLLGMPWRVALALQADGWILRQDIIWAKPNPMPESITDRCTKSHEYIFLLSKSERYYFDHEAIKEPVATSTTARLAQNVADQAGSDRVPGKSNGPMKAVGSRRNSFARTAKEGTDESGQSAQHRADREHIDYVGTRNKRSVWTVPTKGYKGAHFATFPPALIEPCILAGAPRGGMVLDPFNGSGTTGAVAIKHGRNYMGLELNPAYIALSNERLAAAEAAL